jgi:hypothetical protein
MRRTLTRAVVPFLFFGLGVVLVRFGSPPYTEVTWETASEVDTAGFFLYRSDSPDGPFSLLTENPIPAQGDPLVGASYRYEDWDVTWGQRYFYQLEEVERNGARIRLPEVVEGQAGVGWSWAMAMGALLSFLGTVVVAAWHGLKIGNGQAARNDP